MKRRSLEYGSNVDTTEKPTSDKIRDGGYYKFHLGSSDGTIFEGAYNSKLFDALAEATGRDRKFV